MMEVYAAALSNCDKEIGRVLDAIEATGELDNTLVIYIQGDNGASAEGGQQGLLNEMAFFNATPEDFKEVERRMDELGGPMTFNHYPIGWAHAMDTPFQWTKQIASHFGGTRNGMVISWPARIKDKGGIRPQFHHVIDIAPTIYEAVGIEAPSVLNGVPQKPIEGVSMVYTFDSATAPSTHRTQYFEMFANRAIYNDGWVAATTPPLPPWASGKTIPIDDYKWELYDITKDFSEANNMAAKDPKRLRELQELFWIEAAKYQVLPLDNSKLERMNVDNRPSLTRGRTEFTLYPGMVRIPEGTAPSILNKSFRITANVEIPASGAEGILVTQGGRFNGWGLYLLDGKPVFHYNLVGVQRYNVAGPDKLSPGKHTVVVDFKYDGGGLGKGGLATLLVDGKQAAQEKFARTIPFRISADETLDIGEDTGTPVSEDYHVPFKFTGTIGKVVILLGDEKITAADQKAIPAFPGVVAGFFVGVAGVGSFAGAHKTVAGAVVGDRIVGFPRSLHRGDRVGNCGVNAGVVASVEAVHGRFDVRHRFRGGRQAVENESRGDIAAVCCKAETLCAAPAESYDVQFAVRGGQLICVIRSGVQVRSHLIRI